MKRAAPSGVHPTIECPVCLSSAIMPVTLPACRHRMCFSCAKGVAGVGNALCPVCREPFEQEELERQAHQVSIYAKLPKSFRPDPGTLQSGSGGSGGSGGNGASASNGNGAAPVEEAEEDEAEDIKPDVDELNAIMAQQAQGAAPAQLVVPPRNNSGRQEDHYWLYERRSGGWWRFELRDEVEVEKAYKESSTGIKTILLAIGKRFTLDFSRNVQYPEGDLQSPRRIIRVTKEEMRGMDVHGIGGAVIANVWTLD